MICLGIPDPFGERLVFEPTWYVIKTDQWSTGKGEAGGENLGGRLSWAAPMPPIIAQCLKAFFCASQVHWYGGTDR